MWNGTADPSWFRIRSGDAAVKGMEKGTAEKKIHTVLGEIRPERLGFTQCHEHLMLSRGKPWEINPALCMDDLEKSVRETESYRSAGGSALVEAQPVGCNRDSEGLVKIAERAGVFIIASTGFHKMQFYGEGHWIFTAEEKELAKLFISELTEGMCTGMDREYRPVRHKAKAGIIKTALDSCGLQEPYERLFRAAARAQKETGAPLMVHIEKGSSPEMLASFLQKQGVRLEKVYFCHMDRACEKEDSFRNILACGISLEFDTIGRFKYHSDEKELELMRLVLDSGGEDQLLFSLDTTRDRLRAYRPEGVGLAYILETFLPAMRKAGITESQIRKISVENPAGILAW